MDILRRKLRCLALVDDASVVSAARVKVDLYFEKNGGKHEPIEEIKGHGS